MSTDTNPITQPDTWTRIPPGSLPCASCGIAVPVHNPVDNSQPEVEGLAVHGSTQRADVPPPQLDLLVTRCATCAMIRESARALIVGHPDVRGRIGSLDIGTHRMECALDALDVLGVTKAATIDRLTATRGDLMRLLDALTIPGGSARWSAHVQSTGISRAASTRASSARWAHVSAAERQELRDAAAGLLARRVESPVDFPCPADTGLPGCLLCGVGHISELPSVEAERRGVWIEMSADRASIGGRMHAESIDGYVCEVCDRAIDAAHAVGQVAMSMSVRASLGIPEFVRSYEVFPGLVGWAALPIGTPPNSRPWEHVDLSAIRSGVEAILGGLTPRSDLRARPHGIDVRPLTTSAQMVDVW